MTSLAKRGNVYHYSATHAGNRYRLSLGTEDGQVAKKLAGKISFALYDGPKSEVWGALRQTLPAPSFQVLSSGAGVAVLPNLEEFENLFYEKLARREKLGEIAASTHDLYRNSARVFFNWLRGRKTRLMDNITPTVIDEYMIWRRAEVVKNPRGFSGSSLQTDSTTLSAVFNLALEGGVVRKNPVHPQPRVHPQETVHPFSKEELARLEAASLSNPYVHLVYKVFRFTGLRGSDAANLTWSGIDLATKTLRVQTKKRGNWVTIPLAQPLAEMLYDRFYYDRQPFPETHVLDGERHKLYRVIKDLGKKAGVLNTYPHRFRTTLGCQILEGGGSIFDVAKILGDTVSTVERHYAPFTDGMQNRVRNILEA